jgi:hypothetical protein
MAVKVTSETSFGETRELYVRLNNVETSNHGVKTFALFRGFLSKEAFENGKSYVWERSVEFDADVSKPLWKQAYDALAADPEFKHAKHV